ncbi:MAG: hypothetical protein M9905_06145 [Rhizobiaceae bacterium]|nr:hypothetical protein [Rhizobiaceae bacterium]
MALDQPSRAIALTTASMVAASVIYRDLALAFGTIWQGERQPLRFAPEAVGIQPFEPFSTSCSSSNAIMRESCPIGGGGCKFGPQTREFCHDPADCRRTAAALRARHHAPARRQD